MRNTACLLDGNVLLRFFGMGEEVGLHQICLYICICVCVICINLDQFSRRTIILKSIQFAVANGDLLPWNLAHVLRSLVPLFGRNGTAFVHGSRTGPSQGQGFDGRIFFFQIERLCMSGCFVVCSLIDWLQNRMMATGLP